MKTRQIDSVLLRVLFGWVIVGHVSAFSHVRIGHFSTKRDVLASEVSKRRKAVEYAARKTHLLVVSLPDSLIEEVSTQALLDKIIDEGIRTSARRPIMFQFDPSSTAVSTVVCLYFAAASFHSLSCIRAYRHCRFGNTGKVLFLRKRGRQ
jgi:hypothetical protein